MKETTKTDYLIAGIVIGFFAALVFIRLLILILR